MCPCLESNLGRLALSLVTITAQLQKILADLYKSQNFSVRNILNLSLLMPNIFLILFFKNFQSICIPPTKQ